jgi:predicted nuclease of predicted toxin-antitoxin system
MNLVILTKDNDFIIKILKSNPPPKVVLFKVGNMKFSKFDEYLSKNWNKIENEINFN